MSLQPVVRQAISTLAILAVTLSSKPSSAENYPLNKITIVVAFAPGGFADTMARFVAEGLRERLRQTVVIENRAGAGGNIAASFVAHAAPDGYTLLATTTALAIKETPTANKQFSTSDLKTVAIVTSNPEALATSPSNRSIACPPLSRR